MESNITAIKQISNSHFEKTEQFMTKTLQILEKMVDNIDNVIEKVLTLEQQYEQKPDEQYYNVSLFLACRHSSTVTTTQQIISPRANTLKNI